MPAPDRPPWSRLVTLMAALVLLTAGCGGGDTPAVDDAGGAGTGTDGEAEVVTGDEAGTPQPGGSLVYGLEAETSGGWCLPEAQLVASGIMVARTIYDPLTAPNEDGEYVPYLAESVEPNETFDQWTITLRDGITFHDGSPLTAEVVKNNLDAYRGQYRDAAGELIRQPLLFVFTFANIAEVTVLDPLTVRVDTATPWPALPAFLYANGRVGILGQAQLDNPDGCGTDLVGTGPFVLDEWVVNDHFRATRNPDYWRTDGDGTPLPYLDEIEFRPITEDAQRLNSLRAGEIDAYHSTNVLQLPNLVQLADGGEVNLTSSDEYAEVRYGMFNVAQAPFDDIRARRAMAHAFDAERYNQLRNDGNATMANGPFGPGSVGYLEDTGYPDFDLDEARRLVQDYEQDTGQELAFTVSGGPGPDIAAQAQLVQQMAEEAGATVTLRQTEQAAFVNQLIAGDFQAALLRNHPGGDPDIQYSWWYSGSPVNFSRIDDPEIDRLLDAGRTTAEVAERRAIYEDLNRRFAEQVYNLWGDWVRWTVPTAPEVRGVLGPDLPDGSAPFPGLGDGHPTAGLWFDEGG